MGPGAMNQDQSLDIVIDLMTSLTPFALSRIGDGEAQILEGKSVKCHKGSFEFDSKDTKSRELLMSSMNNEDECFYYAIPCRCHWPKHNNSVRSVIKSKNLLLANLLVNGNWKRWTSFCLKHLTERTVFLVVNRKMDVSKLPFEVTKVWRVDDDALKNNCSTHDAINKYVSENNVEGAVFLIAAGPYSCVIVDKCFEKKNTFIDIGSSLDPYMGTHSRRYQTSENHIYCDKI